MRETDNFITQRGSDLYKIEVQNLMSTMQNNDLMVVGRGNDSYKVEWSVVKDELGGGGGGGIYPNTNDIAISPSVSGSGTELDPYVLSPIAVTPFGTFGQTVETITIDSQSPDTPVRWDVTDGVAGERFNQPEGVTDTNGDWSGKLQYSDDPATTTEGTVYTGLFRIGIVHFSWSVTQSNVTTSPTVVTNVSLVESDPEGDRFTSQSFVASSQVTDGIPVSTKTIDAHVDGTLSKQVKFDEPLESQATTPGPIYSDSVSTDYAFAQPVTLAFNGDLSNSTQSTANTSNGSELWRFTLTQEIANSWNAASAVTFYNVPGDGTAGSSSSAVWRNDKVTLLNDTEYTPTVPMNLYNLGGPVRDWVAGDYLFITNQGSNMGRGRCYGISYTIDGVETFLVDGVNQTALTFPASADMEGLANGDDISQSSNFTEPLESSVSTTVIRSTQLWAPSGGVDGKTQMFDGDTDTYATTDSQYRFWWNKTNPAAGGSPDLNIENVTELTVGRPIGAGVSMVLEVYITKPNGTPVNVQSGAWSSGEYTLTAASQNVEYFTLQWIQIDAQDTSSRPRIAYVKINGNILLNDESTTDLTFPAATDMAALAPGDVVSQPLSAPNSDNVSSSTVGSITTTNYNARYSGKDTENPTLLNWENASITQNGVDINDRPVSVTETTVVYFQFPGPCKPTIGMGSTISGPYPNAIYSSDNGVDWTEQYSSQTDLIEYTATEDHQYWAWQNNYGGGWSTRNYRVMAATNSSGVTQLNCASNLNFYTLSSMDLITQEGSSATGRFYSVSNSTTVNLNESTGTWGTGKLIFPSGKDWIAATSINGQWDPSYPVENMWNGTIGSGAAAAQTVTVDDYIKVVFNPPITDQRLRVYTYGNNDYGSQVLFTFLINGIPQTQNAPLNGGGSVVGSELPNSSDYTYTEVLIKRPSYQSNCYAIQVDEEILVSATGIAGTVGSITGTTATLSSSSGTWVNGEDVTTGDKTTTGTVSGVSGTTAILSSSSGGWVNGNDVVGPQKTIVEQNARLYCAFDSNGNITDLQNTPQDPPYTTQASNPGLTFTFPATFPSGQTPDSELPNGTTFTVEVSAENSTSTSGPVSAIVQPEPSGPDAPLAGLTTLFTGNSPTGQTITTGIDLVNNEGLVWIKNRTGNNGHVLTDTITGPSQYLSSNTSDPIGGTAFAITSFLENGFTLGADSNANGSDYDYAAWTFGKAAGYFDIIQYTGNGSASSTISHALATRPGFVITKQTSAGQNSWTCWHTGLTSEQYYITLDNTLGESDGSAATNWAVTDTTFNVCAPLGNNADSRSYIAYVFAEDTPGVIKCGSYVGTNSDQNIDVGFEAQWVLIKSPEDTVDWLILDNKRGNYAKLYPNDSKVESETAGSSGIKFTNPNGFAVDGAQGNQNSAGITYIYVAIAAPPIARSQTNEELAETALKFATFENRSMVKCGNDAEAKRDQLIQSLALEGYSLTEILNYL